MTPGSMFFTVVVAGGLLLLVVGLTTFLWLPLLIIGAVGLLAAPLLAMFGLSAEDPDTPSGVPRRDSTS